MTISRTVRVQIVVILDSIENLLDEVNISDKEILAFARMTQKN